jgi:hypothetical protein
MLEILIRVLIFLGIASFMWSVANSLEQIAKDLRIIAGRSGSKPPAEEPEQLVGT